MASKPSVPLVRLLFVDRLRTLDGIPAQPVRRVLIPKAGKPGEFRPLGIPVLLDRAAQTLATFALEPQWEARFEANSYGFRPGRSGHDAIEALYLAIVHQPKYVLDADIKGCFDNIAQEPLLNKLNTIPRIRRAVKAWLRAGVLAERASPYDGNLPYWAQRLKDHPRTSTTLGRLLAKQHGKCAYCDLTFTTQSLIELDHTTPTSQGGENLPHNYQALHRHCHDQKTANDLRRGVSLPTTT